MKGMQTAMETRLFQEGDNSAAKLSDFAAIDQQQFDGRYKQRSRRPLADFNDWGPLLADNFPQDKGGGQEMTSKDRCEADEARAWMERFVHCYTFSVTPGMSFGSPATPSLTVRLAGC
ncbi:hypothetical protein [Cupriavidus sp. AcVe19-6a]|uniref:hypothetical protein n=1 Tax=Cupriavidus sp. AcVe19-6a TaxID=2821358 RepID=UPI001AE25F08|nr:hypothetical protein [Cupriavidus sp. AcVe19-6a]MBP0639959.1 hypothetical protein [Cupriavidus sp. AcVe19-6a]